MTGIRIEDLPDLGAPLDASKFVADKAGGSGVFLMTALRSYIESYLKTTAQSWITVKSPPYNAKGDGVTNDTTAIQAAINAAQTAGGGVVYFPVGTYLVSSTLQISQSGVKLVGAGHDTSHDYTPAWPTNSNTRAVSALQWSGAVGGTLIAIQPIGDTDNGGGLGGNGVLGLNLFAGVYPYTNAAAIGILLAGVKGGEYDVFGLEFTTATMSFQALNRNAAWNNSAAFNRIPYLGSRHANLGGALRMDGQAGGGNSYNNVFGLIDVLHTNGNGLDLYNCDNNEFMMVRIQRAGGGTGTGVLLHYGATFDGPARANLFHLFSPGHGGVYSDAGGAFPPFENKILFYNPDEDSAPPAPIIGTGSTLYYNTTKQSGACYFSTTVSGAQTIPNNAWTKVAFNTVTVDPATWFDTTNRRWTPRYPGVWNISAAVSLTVTVAAGSQQVQIIKNGATSVARTANTTRFTGTGSLAVVGSVFLNGTTDYLEVQVFQDSTANATVALTADATLFSGTRAA
jgi:hypothetical protein